MDNYIESRSNVLSPSTIRGYKQIARNHFQQLHDCELSAVADMLQAEINEMSRTHSPKTVANAYGFIKSVLSSNGIHVSCTTPQKIIYCGDFLQPEDIPRFIQAINGHRYELAYLLGLHGLRLSEVLDLRVDDFTASVIRVNGSAVIGADGALVHKPTNKNAASNRTVPILIPRVLELLPSEGYVVTASGHAIYKALYHIMRVNKLNTSLSFHDLRRSFCSLCYHLGMSELETMQLGGWSDFATMRRIYTRLSEADRLTAESKLTAFFSALPLEKSLEDSTDRVKTTP